MRKQLGLTLIELLISLVIAGVALVGVSAVFITTIKSTRDVIAIARMEQDVNAALTLMAEDIRRAGYWGPAAEAATDLRDNPFQREGDTRLALGEFTGESSNSCILYTYNLDRNPTTTFDNPDDRFGFRLRSGELEMYRYIGDGDYLCTDTNTGEWIEIIDSELIEVDELTFTLASQAVASQAGITLSAWALTIDLKAKFRNEVPVAKQATTTVLLGNLVAD